MPEIKWTVEAAHAFKAIYNYKKNVHLRKLIDQRLDTLADWPPEKWFDLREKDGVIRFQAENDQFVILTGMFDEKENVVWIYHFELRRKGGN